MIDSVGIRQQVRLPELATSKLHELMKKKQKHTLDINDSPALHVIPADRTWSRKQYFLASDHMRLDRTWSTHIDGDDDEKDHEAARRSLWKSETSHWSWTSEETFENPSGESTDIELVSEQEAIDLLHANNVNLNLERLHYTSQQKTAGILADLELWRDMMTLYKYGKTMTVLQLELESWQASGYQHHNGFSHRVAYIESWRSVEPTANAQDRGTAITESIEEVGGFIRSYPSWFTVINRLRDPLQEYLNVRRLHERSTQLVLQIRSASSRYERSEYLEELEFIQAQLGRPRR